MLDNISFMILLGIIVFSSLWLISGFLAAILLRRLLEEKFPLQNYLWLSFSGPALWLPAAALIIGTILSRKK